WSIVAGRVDALGQLVGRQPSAHRSGDRITGDAHEEEEEGGEEDDGGNDEEEADEDVAPQSAPGGLLHRGRGLGCFRPWFADGCRHVFLRSVRFNACGHVRTQGRVGSRRPLGANAPRGAGGPVGSPAPRASAHLLSSASRNWNAGSRVSSTPLTSLPEIAIWLPCSRGRVGSSSAS